MLGSKLHKSGPVICLAHWGSSEPYTQHFPNKYLLTERQVNIWVPQLSEPHSTALMPLLKAWAPDCGFSSPDLFLFSPGLRCVFQGNKGEFQHKAESGLSSSSVCDLEHPHHFFQSLSFVLCTMRGNYPHSSAHPLDQNRSCNCSQGHGFSRFPPLLAYTSS